MVQVKMYLVQYESHNAEVENTCTYCFVHFDKSKGLRESNVSLPVKGLVFIFSGMLISSESGA